MKNHFDISDSIEIPDVDIAGVACNSNLKVILNFNGSDSKYANHYRIAHERNLPIIFQLLT